MLALSWPFGSGVLPTVGQIGGRHIDFFNSFNYMAEFHILSHF